MSDDTENRVLSSLVALKIATFLNAEDLELEKRAKHKITYFIDADVFGLAIETPSEKTYLRRPDRVKEAANLNLFDELGSASIHMPAEYETTDYIFKGCLPGQRGEKLYVADGHLREIERIRHAVMTRRPPPEGLTEAIKGRDQQAVDELQRFSEEIIEIAVEGVDDAEILKLCERAADLSRILFEPEHETRAPRTFRSTETMLAITTIASSWIPGSVLPSYQQAATNRRMSTVAEWCARIATARRGVRFASTRAGLEFYDQMSDRLRDRIRHDACAIIDVLAMNQLSPPTERVVLITGTSSLHRAYCEWYIDRRRRQIREDYVLRSVVQYMSLINLENYSQAYGLEINVAGSSRATREIVSSLDAFLDPLHPTPSFTRVLELLVATSSNRGRLNDANFELISAQFDWWIDQVTLEAIVKRWRLAYGNSILITLPVLGARRKAHDAILRSALSQAGGDLLAVQNNIVANLEIAHMVSALRVLTDEVKREIEQISTVPLEMNVVRVVLPVLIDLPAETIARLRKVQNSSIDNVLAEATARTSTGSTVSRIIPGEQASSRPDVGDIITNIILSMSLGSWSQAKRLAEHSILVAIDQKEAGFLADDDAFADEFAFLYALSIRYQCQNLEEFNRAVEIFSVEREGAEMKVVLRNARSRLERGTLHLAAALHVIAREKLERAETWPEFTQTHALGNPIELTRKALIDLRFAIELLKVVHLDEDYRQFAKGRLHLQAAVNFLCALAMLHLAGGLPGPDDSNFGHHAESLVAPFYASGEQLRLISILNLEAYRKVSDPSSLSDSGFPVAEPSIDNQSACIERHDCQHQSRLPRFFGKKPSPRLTGRSRG